MLFSGRNEGHAGGHSVRYIDDDRNDRQQNEKEYESLFPPSLFCPDVVLSNKYPASRIQEREEEGGGGSNRAKGHQQKSNIVNVQPLPARTQCIGTAIRLARQELPFSWTTPLQFLHLEGATDLLNASVEEGRVVLGNRSDKRLLEGSCNDTRRRKRRPVGISGKRFVRGRLLSEETSPAGLRITKKMLRYYSSKPYLPYKQQSVVEHQSRSLSSDDKYSLKRSVCSGSTQYNSGFGEGQEEFWSNGTTTLNLSSTSDKEFESSWGDFGKTTIYSTVTNMSMTSKMSQNSGVGGRETPCTRPNPSDGQSENQPSTNAGRNGKGPNIYNSLMAGSVAGVTSTALFHPLDVLRTKMQASSKAAQKSPWTIFRRTVSYGGYKSLYTGLGLPLGAQAVYKATVLTVNTYSRSILLDFHARQRRKIGNFQPVKRLNYIDSYLCGATGGAVNGLLFVTPVELVRNQLIAQHSKLAKAAATATAAAAAAAGGTTAVQQGIVAQGHKKKNGGGMMPQRSLCTATTMSSSATNGPVKVMRGPIDVISRILRSDGLLGLWRGAGITVVRDAVGCGLMFACLDLGKDVYRYSVGIEDDVKSTPLIGTALGGAFAGIGYWAVALPFDTIKTLVQTNKVPNATVAFRDVLKREGVVGLYRGWQVAFGRGAPSAMVALTTYEVCCNALQQK